MFQAAEESEFQAVVVWFTPAMQYFKLPVCDSNYIAYKILLKNHFMNNKTFTQGDVNLMTTKLCDSPQSFRVHIVVLALAFMFF